MAAPKPRIRLSAKEAKKGDIIEIKTLISHPMESGQRKDREGKTIPRKIINKFTCDMNGKVIFSADLEPAVSANPYIQFKIKAVESGKLTFTWVDDDGSKYTASEELKVS